MAYELRIGDAPRAQFDTEQEAVAAARLVLRDNPDAEPEIIDLATGRPAAPGASASWREDLKNQVG